MFITYSGVNSMPDIAMKPNRRLLLFLPLAHVFARYMQFFCFAGNVSLGLSSNLKTILADFKAFKPTFILAVPRIFEKIYNAARRRPEPVSRDVFSLTPPRRHAIGRMLSSPVGAFHSR